MPALEQLQRSLGQIEGKIDIMIDTARQVREDLGRHSAKDDARFSEIERRTYWLSGAWSVVAAGISGATVWLLRGHT